MSTPVRNIEEGQRLAARVTGVPFETTVFTPAPDLRVRSAAAALADPSTQAGSEMIADSILETQHGFRYPNHEGVEVGIVIAPFREGLLCVWGVLPSGRAVRF